MTKFRKILAFFGLTTVTKSQFLALASITLSRTFTWSASLGFSTFYDLKKFSRNFLKILKKYFKCRSFIDHMLITCNFFRCHFFSQFFKFSFSFTLVGKCLILSILTVKIWRLFLSRNFWYTVGLRQGTLIMPKNKFILPGKKILQILVRTWANLFNFYEFLDIFCPFFCEL